MNLISNLTNLFLGRFTFLQMKSTSRLVPDVVDTEIVHRQVERVRLSVLVCFFRNKEEEEYKSLLYA